MAASFKIYNNRGDYHIIEWHIGEPITFDVNQVDDVIVDGDELAEIGVYYWRRVEKFEKNEAKMYAAFMKFKYQDAKPPVITEQGINNLLNPNQKGN